MKLKNKKKLLKTKILSTQKTIIRGTLIIISATLLIIFIFGDHGLFQLYKLKKEKAAIQKQILKFRNDREILITERNRLKNDLKYIEKLAREKYRMAKPGEQVFKVIKQN